MNRTRNKVYVGLLATLFFCFIAYSCKVESRIVNGHEFVDLGLPSGTKWATMNVGADSIYDCGDYYSWGETSVKELYSCETSYTYGKCSDFLQQIGMLNSNLDFNSVCDAAGAGWGDVWETPTKDDYQELFSNTVSEWTTIGGVSGRKFTVPNGNWIFLPAAGRYDESGLYDKGCYGSYWTASSSSEDCYTALSLFFWNEDVQVNVHSDRKNGQPIRPVYKKAW